MVFFNIICGVTIYIFAHLCKGYNTLIELTYCFVSVDVNMPAPPLDVAGSIITQVTKDSENNNDYIIADKGRNYFVKVE